MARWLKRIGLGVLVLIILALVGGVSYEAASRSDAASAWPAPGRLADLGGGRRIQIDCRGSGAPTVVFESGLDTLGALSWAAVQEPVARTTRACAYSRAGIMWSDPDKALFSADRVAGDLHAALAVAGERGPFVLVGHSLGGPYVMTYARLYPAEVAGVVLVDASHPDQIARLRAAAGKDLTPGAGSARFGALVNRLGVLRLLFPNGMPPPHAPPIVAQAGGAWFPPSVPGAARELDHLDAILADAGKLRALGDRPLVVLTRGEATSPAAMKQLKITPAQAAGLDRTWQAMQAEEATWSTHSRHEVVQGAGHYIQFDQPAAVIAAVAEVVEQVRATRP